MDFSKEIMKVASMLKARSDEFNVYSDYGSLIGLISQKFGYKLGENSFQLKSKDKNRFYATAKIEDTIQGLITDVVILVDVTMKDKFFIGNCVVTFNLNGKFIEEELGEIKFSISQKTWQLA